MRSAVTWSWSDSQEGHSMYCDEKTLVEVARRVSASRPLAGAGRDCQNKWKSSDGWGPIADGRGWQNKRKSSGNAPASSPSHWPGCGHPPFSCLVNFPTLITLGGSS